METGLEAFDLSIGEPFDTGAEDVADLEERVVLPAAVAELLLLDPAAGLLHRGDAELDDVECIEHRSGVFELVPDRVEVAAERIQRRHADPAGERFAAGGQPVGVGLPGPARHQVQQPCLRSTVAPGQVHDPGEFLWPFPRAWPMVPVGSGCGALSRLPVVGFHNPPAEPGVRFSPHRALHVLWPLVSR